MEQSSLVPESKPMDQMFDMDKFCTDSFMQGEKVKQIPFYAAGSYTCKQCALYCRKECQK